MQVKSQSQMTPGQQIQDLLQRGLLREINPSSLMNSNSPVRARAAITPRLFPVILQSPRINIPDGALGLALREANLQEAVGHIHKFTKGGKILVCSRFPCNFDLSAEKIIELTSKGGQELARKLAGGRQYEMVHLLYSHEGARLFSITE